ncbi:MAG: MFS transporter [Candidatus Korarchaeota archaeon]|nr:MFS transporter [Candidatus Korarchaeota archaeon]
MPADDASQSAANPDLAGQSSAATSKRERIQRLYGEYWSPRLVTTTYMLVYLTEGAVRSLGIFLPFYLSERFGLGPADIGFFVAAAYIAWHFKFIIGLVMDLTPSVRGWRRRMYLMAGNVMRMVGFFLLARAADPWRQAFPAALIIFSGDALLDIAADALLLDVTPPDYHGMGFGFGWGGRAIGYSLSALFVTWAVSRFGWDGAISLMALYTIPAFAMAAVREPPLTEERRINKRVLALTFTDPRLLAAVIFAIFGASVYSFDPNRGVFSLVIKELSGRSLRGGGLASVAFGLAVAVGSPITGMLADRIGHKRAYYFSLAGAAASLAGMSLLTPERVWLMYPLSFALGFFEGFNFTTWATVLGDLCPPEFPSFLFQYFMSMLHVSAYLTAVFVGWGIEALGPRMTVLLSALYISMGFIPAYFVRPLATGKAERI